MADDDPTPSADPLSLQVKSILLGVSALVTSLGCLALLVQQRVAARQAREAALVEARVGVAFGVVPTSSSLPPAPLVLPIFRRLLGVCALAGLVESGLAWAFVATNDVPGAVSMNERTVLYAAVDTLQLSLEVYVVAVFQSRGLTKHAFSNASITASVACFLALGAEMGLVVWRDSPLTALTKQWMATVLAAHLMFGLIMITMVARALTASSHQRRWSVLPVAVPSILSWMGRLVIGALLVFSMIDFGPGGQAPTQFEPSWMRMLWVNEVFEYAQLVAFPIGLFFTLRNDTRFWRGVGQSAAVNRGMHMSDRNIAALQSLLVAGKPSRWLENEPSRGHGIASFVRSMERRPALRKKGDTRSMARGTPTVGSHGTGGARKDAERSNETGTGTGARAADTSLAAAVGGADAPAAKAGKLHDTASTDATAASEATQLTTSMPSMAECQWFDWQDVVLGTCISTGGSGSVYYGMCKGERVAIKIASPAALAEVDIAHWVEEALWMHSLARNERAVNLIGLFVRPPDLGFVLELCEGGSIASQLALRAEIAAIAAGKPTDGSADASSFAAWMRSATSAALGFSSGGTTSAGDARQRLLPDPLGPTPRAVAADGGEHGADASRPRDSARLQWTWSHALELAAQCADCVAALHAYDPPVCHRDVKSANFLITGDGHVKLGDFGLARVVARERRGSMVSSLLHTEGSMASLRIATSDGEDYGSDDADDTDDGSAVLGGGAPDGAFASDGGHSGAARAELYERVVAARSQTSFDMGTHSGRVRRGFLSGATPPARGAPRRSAGAVRRDAAAGTDSNMRTMTGLVGTPLWMAPELIVDRESDRVAYDESVDVFSLGIVLWEILTSREPYGRLSSATVMNRVKDGELRPDIPAWCPDDYRAVMTEAWAQDPGARPTAADVARRLRACAPGTWSVPVQGFELHGQGPPPAAGAGSEGAVAAEGTVDSGDGGSGSAV